MSYPITSDQSQFPFAEDTVYIVGTDDSTSTTSICVGGEYLKKKGEREVSMKTKLKPCPHCGGRAIYDIKRPLLITQKRDTLFRIKCGCSECGCATRWWYPKYAAAQAWNKRV